MRPQLISFSNQKSNKKCTNGLPLSVPLLTFNEKCHFGSLKTRTIVRRWIWSNSRRSCQQPQREAGPIRQEDEYAGRGLWAPGWERRLSFFRPQGRKKGRVWIMIPMFSITVSVGLNYYTSEFMSNSTSALCLKFSCIQFLHLRVQAHACLYDLMDSQCISSETS